MGKKHHGRNSIGLRKHPTLEEIEIYFEDEKPNTTLLELAPYRVSAKISKESTLKKLQVRYN